MLKMVDYKKQGKRNRAAGARFEKKVREDLEKKGWIVSRWCNNVECIKYNKESCKDPEDWGELKLIPAKHQYRGPGIPMSIGTGFPDFVCFRQHREPYYLDNNYGYLYGVIGVECKTNGYLSKEEKEKCKWLLENNVFSKILIAKKGKKRGEIVYTEFK